MAPEAAGHFFTPVQAAGLRLVEATRSCCLLLADLPVCLLVSLPACLLLLLLLRLLLFEITTFFDSLLKFRTVWLAMLAYVNMFRFACLFAWSLLHLPFYFYMCDQSSADGRVTIASTSAGGAASDPETFKHTNSKS